MDINERIVYSKEEMLHSLESALDDMRVFRYDSRYRHYFGELFSDKFSIWEKDIIRRKDEPFTIVVVGAFKRGKSTLINALLGETVVTMDVTPETVTTNRISYGIHENLAILLGNRRVKLTDEELKRESLEELLSKVKDSIVGIEIHRPNEFLKKITIIDTPGTDDASNDYTDSVKKVLLQADAVIYVFNVRFPISQTEQFFLRSAIAPQKLTRLFIVGNHTDDLGTQENVERCRDTVRSRISALLPETKIYMVSALDEFCDSLGEERLCPELSDLLSKEFENLRCDISSLVAEEADGVGVARFHKMITLMISDLSAQIENIEHGIHMSTEEAQTALNNFAEQKETKLATEKDLLNGVKEQIESMKNETKGWMREFLQRIIDETQNLYNEKSDILRKYYEYYCVDLLQQALNTCLEYHREQIYGILNNISSPLSDKVADSLSVQDVYQFRFKLENHIWTKGDTAGLAVSLLSNVPFLATVGLMAADGITGYIREREIKSHTPRLIEQINKKMTELSISMDKVVDGVYQSMGDNLEKIVIDYISEQIEIEEEMVKQTVSVSRKEEARKKEIAALLTEARNVLTNAEARLA